MQIDHIELFVPDRQQAATWYSRVLGFALVEEYRDWAEDPRGPLMISNDGGHTLIALFQGPPQDDVPPRGFRRLAFRVAGEKLVRFVESSGGWRSSALGPDEIQDHGKAISVYFADPWGNSLEVTTYEPTVARSRLLGS